MSRLMLVAAAGRLIAAGPAPTPDAIVGPVLQACAAAAHADAGALARLYAEDAELISAAGSASGRGEITDLYKGAFAGGMNETALSTKLESVRTVAPGAIFTRGSWIIAPTAASGEAAYCGRFFAVLKQVKAIWRIDTFNEVQLACDDATK